MNSDSNIPVSKIVDFGDGLFRRTLELTLNKILISSCPIYKESTGDEVIMYAIYFGSEDPLMFIYCRADAEVIANYIARTNPIDGKEPEIIREYLFEDESQENSTV